jgi:AhpD family alkylhydroperoxidase
VVTVEVFDPAMCCSTGVCGPSVDPALARFASDLDWLAAQDAQVRRYNLGQEPGAFAENAAVRSLLHEQGENVLPVVIVNGEVASSGRFPSREELAGFAGVSASPPAVSSDVIAELAAIGAAVGSNCEPCFKYHYNEARKLGLTDGELVLAVRTAQMVKDTPANAMLDLAAKLLHVDRTALGDASPEPAADDACCGPTVATLPMADAAAGSGGCC